MNTSCNSRKKESSWYYWMVFVRRWQRLYRTKKVHDDGNVDDFSSIKKDKSKQRQRQRRVGIYSTVCKIIQLLILFLQRHLLQQRQNVYTNIPSWFRNHNKTARMLLFRGSSLEYDHRIVGMTMSSVAAVILISFFLFLLFASNTTTTRQSLLPMQQQQRRQPKQVGYYFQNHTSHGSTILGYQEFSPHLMIHPLYPYIVDSQDEGAFARQAHLKNSKDYNKGRVDSLDQGDCIQQHSWQSSAFPSCNSIHEMDLSSTIPHSSSHLLTHGYWRDIWSIQDFHNSNKTSTLTLKTLRYKHEWSPRNMDRHRRDAVATQLLTQSPWIVQAYAYCGHSIVMEYGQYDLYTFVQGGYMKEDDPIYRIKIGYQIASSIADIHNTPVDGVASIAHTDISPGQFIYSKGIFKLNDFNRCRFMTRNNKTHQPCPFFVENSPGPWRSPEEYIDSSSPLNEKIDVYSMGNVFYYILTKERPFGDLSGDEVQERIRRGERPYKGIDVLKNSTHWATQALIHAMEWCWTHNATDRPTARTIQVYLESQLEQAHVVRYATIES